MPLSLEDKILRLLDRLSYGLTIEEISTHLDISRPTAAKYLFGLEKEGELTARIIGKYRLHYPKATKIRRAAQ